MYVCVRVLKEKKGGGGGGGGGEGESASSVINLGDPCALPVCQPIASPEIINDGRGGFPLVTGLGMSHDECVCVGLNLP